MSDVINLFLINNKIPGFEKSLAFLNKQAYTDTDIHTHTHTGHVRCNSLKDGSRDRDTKIIREERM